MKNEHNRKSTLLSVLLTLNGIGSNEIDLPKKMQTNVRIKKIRITEKGREDEAKRKIHNLIKNYKNKLFFVPHKIG